MNGNMIKLSKSDIGIYEILAVFKVLKKAYLGMGSEVQLFEDNLKNIFKREVVCVSSGTAALQLAIESCEIGKGDEILVPSFTFVATYQAISGTGAKPISCDINPNTLLIDLNDAQKKTTKNTKAIIPVYFTGGVGEIDKTHEFALKNNLRLIEDAAHAFGTSFKNKLIGSFGDITCFSFDGIKNITSGEGGCVISNDQKLLEKIKNKRLLGVINDTHNRYEGKRSWEFDVKEQGWRYHMSNIFAAIGNVQLTRFKKFSIKRKELAKLYDKQFKNCNNIFPIKRNYQEVVPHIYVVRLASNINRDEIRHSLLKLNIEIGFHYFPNHLLNYYNTNEKLPQTESIYKNLISLPLHTKLKTKDVKYVAKNLIKLTKIV